jgi:hypothetical protein
MTQELKACPFCQSNEAKVSLEDEDYVVCAKCGSASHVDLWNTRPREDALEAEVEALRGALTDAYNCFRVYGEHMPEYMHGEPLKVHLKRYRTALGETQ